MIIIAGLGNPDSEYEGTRHNTGFEVVDVLAGMLKIRVNRKRFKGLYGKGKPVWRMCCSSSPRHI